MARGKKAEPLSYALRHECTPLLLFFPRLTLSDVARLVRKAPRGRRLRTLVRKLFHWRMNLRIANAQLITHLGWWRTGLWEFIHVAVLIPLEDGGQGRPPHCKRWVLLESTFPAGVELKDPEAKLAGFHGVATAAPPRWPPALEACERLIAWAHEVEGLPYDSAGAGGSPFDLNLDGRGRFCSDVGANAWQILGMLPEWIYRPHHRSGELRKAEMPPRLWDPLELAAELGANCWERAVNVTGGRPSLGAPPIADRDVRPPD